MPRENKHMTVNSVGTWIGRISSIEYSNIHIGNDLAGLQIVCQRQADYLSTVSTYHICVLV